MYKNALYKNKMPFLLQILLCVRPVNFIANTIKSVSTPKIAGLLQRAALTDKIRTSSIYQLQGVLALISILAGCFISKYLLLILPAAYFAPLFLLHFLAARNERRVHEELGLFTEIIFISLRARLNLREALEEAASSTVFLKPALRVCLNEWMTDKERALHTMKSYLPFPAFQLVVDLLIQVARVGDERIIDFIEENKKLEDEFRKLEVSARSKIRPVLITFQMVLPFGVILLVLFYPLLIQVRKILNLF